MTDARGAARLCLPGHPEALAPDELRWSARLISPEAVAMARVLAFEAGRVLERDHSAVLSWGEAARLELGGGLNEPGAASQTVALLRAIPAGDKLDSATERAAVGPVALGALPFFSEAAGGLSIPAITVITNETSSAVAIAVAPEQDLVAILAGFPFSSEPPAPAPAPPSSSSPPDVFALASERPHSDFKARIAAAIEAINAGELDKVVLVREVTVQANRPLLQRDLLGRLRALHPSCAAFAIEGFVGASPELLCRRRGRNVSSQPLAGTVARSGDPDEDARLSAALLASDKERAEHRFVVEAITTALSPYCEELHAPKVPHLFELRNVAHLATLVEGTLREGPEGPAANVLELVASLHPTPAVGGAPRDAALEYLAKHEDLDRDRFAGPVGFVRADGDGEWWIAIRSALINGCDARLFAGVGVVADSDPDAELTETQLKLQALLAAVVRP